MYIYLVYNICFEYDLLASHELYIYINYDLICTWVFAYQLKQQQKKKKSSCNIGDITKYFFLNQSSIVRSLLIVYVWDIIKLVDLSSYQEK